MDETLRRYLDLRIDELRVNAAEREKSAEKEKVKTEVGQMVTRLSVLALYALGLGLAFQPLIIAELSDPAQVAGRTHDAMSSLTIINSIPEAYRATVLGICGALALLIFRSTPLGIRFSVGGILFMGAVALSLVGLAAAASAGTVGAVAALPGIAASIVIVYEFSRMLQGTSKLNAEKENSAGSIDARAMKRLGGIVNQIGRRVGVVDSLPVLVVFLIVPLVTVAAVGAAAALDARSGPLYQASWTAQRGFILWCLWAFAVTPAAVRIPLWSLLIWSFFFVNLFTWAAVSSIYALAALATVLINVVLLVLSSRSALDRTKARIKLGEAGDPSVGAEE